MYALRGYEIKDKLYESPRTLIYRAIRQKDNLSVIIKCFNTNKPTPQEIDQFNYEFKVGSSMYSPFVVKYYALEEYGPSKAIVISKS